MTEPKATIGGWSEPRDADEDSQRICDRVVCLVKGKTTKIYPEYKAVKYSKQVVSGTNWLVKVRVGERHYIHVQVWQTLPCNGGWLELSGVQENKTQDDPLEPLK